MTTENTGPQRGHLWVEYVTPAHIPDLETMIGQQADHHLCNYVNDSARLTAEIGGEYPVLNSFIVYSDEHPDRPLGYAAYMMYWTFEGKTLYLEDLCSDALMRKGGGIGRFAFSEVRRIAEEAECHSIKWAAMGSNTGALRFYHKQGAHESAKNFYDLENLLTVPMDITADYTAERITDCTPVLPDVLCGVTDDPRAAVFSVKNHTGEVKALVLANANYSTFRGMTGLHVEPVKFLDGTTSDTDKKSILTAAFAAVSGFARDNGLTGHLCAYAKKDCDASNDFLMAAGTGPARMNDDPASVFICMAAHLPPKPLDPA